MRLPFAFLLWGCCEYLSSAKFDLQWFCTLNIHLHLNQQTLLHATYCLMEIKAVIKSTLLSVKMAGWSNSEMVCLMTGRLTQSYCCKHTNVLLLCKCAVMKRQCGCEKVPMVYNSLCTFSFAVIIVKTCSMKNGKTQSSLLWVKISVTKRSANDEKLLRSASCQLLDYTVVDWRKNTIIRSNYNDLLQLQSDILIIFKYVRWIICNTYVNWQKFDYLD